MSGWSSGRICGFIHITETCCQYRQENVVLKMKREHEIIETHEITKGTKYLQNGKVLLNLT